MKGDFSQREYIKEFKITKKKLKKKLLKHNEIIN